MATISQKPMRIAMFSIHSSPVGPLGTQNTGGMSVYVRELARWLGHQGCLVDIFTYVQGPEYPLDLYPGVRLIHLISKNHGEVSKEQLPTHIEAIFNALDKYCQSQHMAYDVIHSHYWISAVLGAMAQARWHCPHLMMFHTLGTAKNHTRTEETEPIRRIAHERWLAKVADGIVTPSSGDRQNLLCHYHPKPEIIHTIPGGVNLDRFQPMDRATARKTLGINTDAQVALYVGRFAPVKGIDNLIGAVDLLKTRLPNLNLVIVGGDGPEAESARRLTQDVHQRHLEKRITFAGRIDQKALPLYYSAADFLALPSHYESFGLVVLEALACGTPVVATPVGAVGDILKEGINGAIAENPHEEALARAITQMLSAPRASQTIIRATVANFSWKQIAAAMTKTYGLLLDAHNQAGRPQRMAARKTRSK